MARAATSSGGCLSGADASPADAGYVGQGRPSEAEAARRQGQAPLVDLTGERQSRRDAVGRRWYHVTPTSSRSTIAVAAAAAAPLRKSTTTKTAQSMPSARQAV